MKNKPVDLQEVEINAGRNNCADDKLTQILLRAENVKGSYLTPFDRLLLEFLYTKQVIISTEELWMTLKREGIKISIATVQLCLNRFHRCGLLEKQRLEGEKKHCYSFIN